jgi:hypothetical protein
MSKYYVDIFLFKLLLYCVFFCFFAFGATAPPLPPVAHGLLIHEVFRSHTTTHHIGKTPLDEWSARRRDLHLKTNKTNNRQISTPAMGFETLISAGEQPQTYALERAATGTGFTLCGQYIIYTLWNNHWKQFLFAFFLFLHVIPWMWKHLSFKKFLNVFIFPYSL